MNKTTIITGAAVAAIVMNVPCEAASREDVALQALQQYINLVQSAISAAHQGAQTGNIDLASAVLYRHARAINELSNQIQRSNYSREFGELFVINNEIIQQLKQLRSQTDVAVTSSACNIAGFAGGNFGLAWAELSGACAGFESIGYSLYSRN